MFAGSDLKPVLLEAAVLVAIELPTIRLLTSTRYVASHSRRIKAIRVCWPYLINWRSKEDFFQNITDRVGQHLIWFVKAS